MTQTNVKKSLYKEVIKLVEESLLLDLSTKKKYLKAIPKLSERQRSVLKGILEFEGQSLSALLQANLQDPEKQKQYKNIKKQFKETMRNVVRNEEKHHKESEKETLESIEKELEDL